MVAVAAMSCGQKGPKIHTQADTEIDLGTVKEIDGVVTVKLLCKNTYADTLRPVRIDTPCGCTAAQTDRKPIAPGEEEEIEVSYNPAYRPGPFMHEIKVIYKDSPVKVRYFIIKGNVKGYTHPIEEDRPYNMGEGLYMSHKVLSFGNMVPGETRDIFFRHGNGNQKKADIRFDIPDEWKSCVRMRQPGKMKADERDTIHVKFTMPEEVDTIKFKIQPLVNGVPTEKVVAVIATRRAENQK